MVTSVVSKDVLLLDKELGNCPMSITISGYPITVSEIEEGWSFRIVDQNDNVVVQGNDLMPGVLFVMDDLEGTEDCPSRNSCEWVRNPAYPEEDVLLNTEFGENLASTISDLIGEL